MNRFGIYNAADNIPIAARVEPFDFDILSNLFVTDEAGVKTFDAMRLVMSVMHTPAVGAEDDTYTVTLASHQEASLEATSTIDETEWTLKQTRSDFRVHGRAVRLGISGKGVKTLFRWGHTDLLLRESGERG